MEILALRNGAQPVIPSLSHSFLVATPSLVGSHFGDSIIYVCQHDANGAMGFVINRMARMNARRLARTQGIPALPEVLDVPVFDGGPVAPEQGFVLHTDERKFESTLSVASGIVLSSSGDALRAALGHDKPAHVAIFLGYAGWGAGQLEGELEENAWLTAPASREVLFELPCELRRQQVAKMLGIDLRMLAARTGHA